MGIKKAKRIYNEFQVAALAAAFKKSFQTIKRWIDNNDDRLTSEKAKEALSHIQKAMNGVLPQVQTGSGAGILMNLGKQ